LLKVYFGMEEEEGDDGGVEALAGIT